MKPKKRALEKAKKGFENVKNFESRRKMKGQRSTLERLREA